MLCCFLSLSTGCDGVVLKIVGNTWRALGSLSVACLQQCLGAA